MNISISLQVMFLVFEGLELTEYLEFLSEDVCEWVWCVREGVVLLFL